jgi:hypothetical protein
MNVKAGRILLTSAARTATTACVRQSDAESCFLRVYLVVTAASGTGGLTVFIRGYDKATLTPAKLNAGGGAVITTGVFVYELSTSSQTPAGDVKETVARLLPCIWDVNVAVGDASSYTYSVSCEVVSG